ncbi:DNA ligase 1 [Yarrowia lipolytica]|nr:DNA ligase 1 [Yarrowia lipolytica]
MAKQQTLNFFGTKRKASEEVEDKKVAKVKIETKTTKSPEPETSSKQSPKSPKKQSPKSSNKELSASKQFLKSSTSTSSLPSTKTVCAETAKKLAEEGSGHTHGPLLYRTIVDTFEKIEATTKRLEITAHCAALFLSVLKSHPQMMATVVYLCINRLGPDYEGLELGLGESLLMKSIAESTGRTPAYVKTEYQKLGDLGKVAQSSKSNQRAMFKPEPLKAANVFDTFREIAQTTGKDSQNAKINMIKRMMGACQGNEAKFIIRSLEGKLRIGLAEKSVLVSLSQAFVTFEAENKGKKVNPDDITAGEEMIRDVFCQLPNYALIIDAILENGIMRLSETCKISTGVPLKPMLAKPTKSISEVLDRFQDTEFTCEYKYDGERAQIHKTESGEMFVYSRNSEDMTVRYPDLVSIIPKFAGEAKSFILDCEAVAWDRKQNKILPFQVLSTRKRKNVNEEEITVRVCIFAFDILYLNGESLLTLPLAERRQKLKEAFTEVPGEFLFAKSMDTSNVEEIQTFLDQSIKDSCEGLMVKLLEGKESGYEPSKRSRNWLKVKKDYIDGIGDSLDLVILGGYFGKGKRSQWYGAFLLGVYNQDSEEFETVCKTATGFSEEMLQKMYDKLKPTVIETPHSDVSYDSTPANLPDVWFDPSTVIEILAADLSLSPVYKAGIDQMDRGISLRFPRFIRVRDDKGIHDATSSDQIVEMYQNQAALVG